MGTIWAHSHNPYFNGKVKIGLDTTTKKLYTLVRGDDGRV